MSKWPFPARSEGCRHSLEATHNPKVVGSNPTPNLNQRPRELGTHLVLTIRPTGYTPADAPLGIATLMRPIRWRASHARARHLRAITVGFVGESSSACSERTSDAEGPC